MDSLFSPGDVALTISIIWVLLAGSSLLITYLVKAYSTASYKTERLFTLSWIILIPGGITLVTLAHITNQINHADGTEANYYNTLDYYAPLLKILDKTILPTFIITLLIAFIISYKKIQKD